MSNLFASIIGLYLPSKTSARWRKCEFNSETQAEIRQLLTSISTIPDEPDLIRQLTEFADVATEQNADDLGKGSIVEYTQPKTFF